MENQRKRKFEPSEQTTITQQTRCVVRILQIQTTHISNIQVMENLRRVVNNTT